MDTPAAADQLIKWLNENKNVLRSGVTLQVYMDGNKLKINEFMNIKHHLKLPKESESGYLSSVVDK